MRVKLPSAPSIPARIATGGFILQSGLGKWGGGAEQAAGVQGMAAGAFPFLASIPAPTFLRVLSAGEITVGGLLLAPFVPSVVAGAALTGFSGALVAMYLRTPALHKPGSIWPTQAGIGVSKDVWMLGIGLALVLDDITRSRRS